jgi:glycosyltransferase involved in cell wall biosynthesis
VRISLVTETYFPQVNGVSRTLSRLVKTALNTGHEIQLLIPRYGRPIDQSAENLEIRDFASFPLPFYKEILLPCVTPAMIRRTLARFEPDVVHIATEGTLGLAALLAARKMEIPVATSYHTNFPQYLAHYHLGLLEPLSWSYLRWFHNSAACTQVPTQEMRTHLEGKNFKNVNVWERGVDPEQFTPDKRDEDLRLSLGIGSEEMAFLYVGRLAPEKNLMAMVAAFTSLDAAVPSKLVLVGDGPYRETLERMENPRIVLTGYRYEEELARLYASADVFLFPSLTDTFGNVNQEAMASGLPVVAFDVTGPRSVVRNFETGLLVRDLSVSAFASAMRDVALNADLRLDLAENALMFARSREWDLVNAVCLEMYEKIVLNA